MMEYIENGASMNLSMLLYYYEDGHRKDHKSDINFYYTSTSKRTIAQ